MFLEATGLTKPEDKYSMPHFSRVENKNIHQFKWGAKKTAHAKDSKVQFYRSFTYEGVEYFIYDNVYLLPECATATEAYIGKLVNMWETSAKQKRIRVVWYFRPTQIRPFLGDYEPRWNELFLASGDGKGVSNVGPPEALIGKCPIVCASSDDRNALQSTSELQEADYFFSHAFDVQTCTILEYFPDTIDKLPVQYFFNRNPLKTICSSSNSRAKEEPSRTFSHSKIESGKVVVNASVSGTADSQNKDSRNNKDFMGGGDNFLCRGSSLKLKIKVKENGRICTQHDEGEKARAENLLQCTSETQPSKKRRLLADVYPNTELEDSIRVQPKEVPPTNLSVFPLGKPDYKDEISETDVVAGPRKTLADDIKALEFALVKDDNIQKEVADVTRICHDECVGTEGISCRKVVSPYRKLSGGMNLHSVGEVNGDEAPESTQGKYAMMENKVVLVNKWVDAVNFDSDSPRKKPADGRNVYLDVELNDPRVPPCAQGEDAKIENKVMEVTKRPGADKKKWFNTLPWEEKMQTAHVQKTLVWFYNLDPMYTSSEVEDIVWNAFKLKADAKVIPSQSFSGRYYGQALVIFKSQDAADSVISQTKNKCLMINGRPLVAQRRTLIECVNKLGSFPGHLVLDKIRLKQRDSQKNAVSSSHCAQLNTIEYEMSLDWIVLQAKADLWWKALHEEQAKEISFHRHQIKGFPTNLESKKDEETSTMEPPRGIVKFPAL